MACNVPPIYIENLRTCNVLDDSLKDEGGLLVTSAGSSDIEVVAASLVDSYVLAYNSALSPPVEWVVQSGGAAVPSYEDVTAFPATIVGTRDVVTIDASAEAPDGTYNVTLNNGTTNGHTMIIKIVGISANSTIRVTPGAGLLGGGTRFEFEAVAQGVQVVWLSSSTWASVPGGAHIA